MCEAEVGVVLRVPAEFKTSGCEVQNQADILTLRFYAPKQVILFCSGVEFRAHLSSQLVQRFAQVCRAETGADY